MLLTLVRRVMAIARGEEEGQGLAEYALVIALVALIAIIALFFLGGSISKNLSTVGHTL